MIRVRYSSPPRYIKNAAASLGSRARLAALMLLSVIAASHLVIAQKTVSLAPPATDGQTQALLRASLNAMGGEQAWAGVSDETVTGSCVSKLPTGEAQTAKHFQWTTSGREFRYVPDTDNPGTALVSGHGKPSRTDEKGTKHLTAETARLALPYHLPGRILLTILHDSHYASEVIGNETVNGSLAIHFRTMRFVQGMPIPGTTQDWWIDPSTHLPVKVQYFVPGQQIIAYAPMTKVYSKWSGEANGLLVPHEIDTTMNGSALSSSCAVDGMQVNTKPDEALFDGR